MYRFIEDLRLVKTVWPQREPAWIVEAMYHPDKDGPDQEILAFYPMNCERHAEVVDPADLGFNGRQCDSIWDALGLQYEIDRDVEKEGGV